MFSEGTTHILVKFNTHVESRRQAPTFEYPPVIEALLNSKETTALQERLGWEGVDLLVQRQELPALRAAGE